MSTLHQKDIQPRRGHCGCGEVPLGLGGLDMPLQPRAVLPGKQVARAVDRWQAAREQVRMHFRIQCVENDIGYANAPRRSMPVLHHLAIVVVGGTKVDEVALGCRPSGRDEWSILR